MSNEIEGLRKQALCLLQIKESLRTQIKETETMLKQLTEEPQQTKEFRDEDEVLKSTAKLEEVILDESGKLMCQEKALRSAEMSSAMRKHLGWGLERGNETELLAVDEAKQLAVLELIEMNNSLQTKYLDILNEVQDLKMQVNERQRESLELIMETRKVKQDYDKMKENPRETDQAAVEMEKRLTNVLEENLQMHHMISTMFYELILSSKINYYEDPKLRTFMLKFGQKLELAK